MGLKLPRIEATISMVDNVTATMRTVRQSVEAISAPVDKLKNSLSSLSRESNLSKVGSSIGVLREKMGGIGDGAKSSLGRLTGVLMGSGGALFGLGALVNTSAEASYRLGMLSNKLGITADSVAKFRYASTLKGGSADTADAALEKFGKQLAEARAGAGKALAPLQALGVHLKDATGKARPMTDVLMDVSDSMAKVRNGQDRLRLASDLFGKGNTDFVNTMSGGSGELKKLFAEYNHLKGPVKAANLEMATSYMESKDRMGIALSSMKMSFAGPLIPAITSSMQKITELSVSYKPLVRGIAAVIAQHLPGAIDSFGQSFERLVRTAEPVVVIMWKLVNAIGPAQVVFGSLAYFILGPFVRSLVTTVPAVFQLAGALSKFGTIAGGTILKYVPIIVTTLGSLASFIVTTVVPAIWSMGVAFMSTPLGWIVAAVAVIAGAAFLIWKNWSTVSGWITSLWSTVSGFLDTSIGKILAVFVFPMIGIPLLIIKHWDVVSGWIIGLWNGITAFLASVFSSILSTVLPPILAIPGLISEAWGELTGFVSDLWDGISAFFDTGIGRALMIAVPFIGLPVLIIKHWGAIKGFFAGLWDSIGSAFRGFVNFVSNLWTNLNNAVSNGAGALSQALQGIPIVGPMLSAGAAFFQNSGAAAAPAATGAVGATAGNVEGGIVRQHTTVGVDFSNLPPGARVSEPRGNAPVSVTSGFAFGGLF